MEDVGDAKVCALCQEVITDHPTKLGTKGKASLDKIAKDRDDFALSQRLAITPCFIHEICRKHYIVPQQHVDKDDEPGPKRLRSSMDTFQWKTHCFLCGEIAGDTRHPNRDPVRIVETMEIRTALLNECDNSTEWSSVVKARLLDCHDLVAVEARYHYKCRLKFRKISESNTTDVGRPIDDEKVSAFTVLCKWLETEGDAEIYSVNELYEQMVKLATSDKVYSLKTFREKLKCHYREHIYFSFIGGRREEVACFKNMVSFIISDTWYQDRKHNEADECERIMIAAAKIIREEIRQIEYNKDFYPNPQDLIDYETICDFLAPSLYLFLDTLMKKDLKLATIGHAITQAVRPRSVLSPMLFGIAVEMDLVFGSKWLIDELFSLGFSVSYDEVCTFKQSILKEPTVKCLESAEASPTQFVADNADSNLKTLDGSGTFHGLGFLRITKLKNKLDSIHVKRLAKSKVSEVVKDRSIPIHMYESVGKPALSVLKFKPIVELQNPFIPLPSIYYSNLLWQASGMLRRSLTPEPHWLNWSGFMQHVFLGRDKIDVDDITILPLIDLNPSDETTLYSCILYIEEQVKKLKLSETTLTFDQPLYIKSEEIVRTKNIKSVVIRLGSFHTLMSAVGAVFGIMKGSGIESALGCVYGSNAIIHMMSGKAIARALRGLFLLDAGLSYKLLELILPTNGQTVSEDEQTAFDSCRLPDHVYEQLGLLLSDCIGESNEDDILLDRILDSNALQVLKLCIHELKTKLSKMSRTAKLWLQFMEHVCFLREFIACERLKSWEGHLNATLQLLNMFAASGHLHYAKSARLYLQNMRNLRVEHPNLYKLYYDESFHAVQRSSHVFNGLSTDLVIEQVLMAALKGRGGLTHGRGLTESVRHFWVYTMHHCAELHNAMVGLTGKKHSTSEQHIDLSSARRQRDSSDLEKVVSWFDSNNPFDCDISELVSLSTGLTAGKDEGINCDEAESIGNKIQMQMDNAIFNEAKMKRAAQVKTLEDLKPGVKIAGKQVHIDPAVLMLRCHAVAKRTGVDVESFFRYELTAEPSSLFCDNFMRHANKSDLASEILMSATPTPKQSLTKTIIVVDGGWLLHKVRWRKMATYGDVLHQYLQYVNEHFGPSVIVFDGYEQCTKDHEHLRRMKSCKKRENNISINRSHLTKNNQDAFFANVENKKLFISELTSVLVAGGHSVAQCRSDADTTVVAKTVQLADNEQPVTIVANDTDILVMLLYHWRNDMVDIFLLRETTAKGRARQEFYSIRDVCDKIDPIIKNNLLFAHAWSGCDTTSHCFGFGKTSILKLILNRDKVRTLASTIDNSNNAETIGQAGSELFTLMYDGSVEGDLTKLRHQKFETMMAQRNMIDVSRIPPSPRAAHFHSLRVHLQIRVWKTLDENILDPCDWGWNLTSDGYIPIKTDLQPIPDSIENVVRCSCKSKKNPCTNQLCSCKKNGLKCVESCSGCHGRTCQNGEKIDLNE